MTAQQVEAGMGDVDIEVGADSGRPSVDGASLGDLTRHSMGRLRAVSWGRVDGDRPTVGDSRDR